MDEAGRVQVQTRRAGPSDLDRAAEVLGEAFADYPWTRWTVDADDHVGRVTMLQRLALQHYGVPFGQVWVSGLATRVDSVAVWMDSSVAVPPTVHDRLTSVRADLEGSRHAASVAADQELQAWRPDRRHHYLATLGTVPGMQGRGLARAALGPVLHGADHDGVCAFLETSSASNVAFYAKLRFEVAGHLRISGGGPDVWAMLRRPLAC